MLAAFAATSACDCQEASGVIVEIVDADTLEPVADAEVVVASTIYSPRHAVEGVLDPGEYWLWARAPGYRLERQRVTVEMRCIGFEDDPPERERLVVELEPR